MRNWQGLDLLLETGVKETAPCFIIYCVKPTTRLIYTCDFIFKTVLKINYLLTGDRDEFKTSALYKINYSKEKLPGIVQVVPHQLLFESGIPATKPQAFFKGDLIYFYPREGPASEEIFPFDIFSSVFYFISRAEEWQTFEKDRHGRFEAQASILFQNKIHLKPVVDLWILEFRKYLQAANKNISFPPNQFFAISTIDIDNLFAYKNKGGLRMLGGCLKDLAGFDFINLKERLKVVTGKAKDPFDIYESVSGFCLEQGIPLVCFFLLRTGTKNDRTIDPRSKAFKEVFDILKNNKTVVGLHPSYDAAFEEPMLKRECELFAGKNGEPVKVSRQHFLRFDIRTTPNLLLKNGIQIDATMGFASTPGFRAGTSYPFSYFDFSGEIKTNLRFLPFCAMDGAYVVYDKIKAEETFNSMFALATEIKKTGGFFITVFHERTFSDHLYPGFGTLYKNLHLRIKDI